VVDVGLGQLVLIVCMPRWGKCREFAACFTEHCAVTQVLTVK